MKTLGKVIACALSVVLLLALLAGCSDNSTMAYTFSVDNGDSIKLSLNTMDGYELTSELPFTISCEGNVLSQGSFILGDAYAQYVNIVEEDVNAELLDSGTKDGNEYIFWCYNGAEYNYAVLIADSSTGIVLGNVISEDSAKECFDRLTITAED